MDTLRWTEMSAARKELESEGIPHVFEDGNSTNAWCLEEVVEAYAYAYKKAASLAHDTSSLHSSPLCGSRSLSLTATLQTHSLLRLDSLPRFHSLSKKSRIQVSDLQTNLAIQSTFFSTMSTIEGADGVFQAGESQSSESIFRDARHYSGLATLRFVLELW